MFFMHSVNFPYAIQEITMLNNAIKLARLGTRDLKSQRQNIKLSSLHVCVGLESLTTWTNFIQAFPVPLYSGQVQT